MEFGRYPMNNDQVRVTTTADGQIKGQTDRRMDKSKTIELPLAALTKCADQPAQMYRLVRAFMFACNKIRVSRVVTHLKSLPGIESPNTKDVKQSLLCMSVVNQFCSLF